MSNVMFRHLFTIIWNNRKNNLWLIVGMFIISASLWYSVDYIYAVAVNQNKTLGFDWHHVYKINIGALTPESIKFRSEPEHTAAGNNLVTFLNRLEQHPAVESVCLTQMHKHYQWTNQGGTLKVDTFSTGLWHRTVTPEYFKVFRVKGADGSSPEELASKAVFTDLMITKEVVEKLFPDGNAVNKTVYSANLEDSVRISAVIESQKYNEYTNHQRAAYQILNLNELSGVSYDDVPWYGSYIRIRPDADVDGFMSSFRKEMRTQLMIGNLYLEDMRPMSTIRDEQLKDYRNDVYTYYTVIVFFLLNAFLAVLGTFWSRTQQRRSELALRVAIGSSKQKINNLLNYEGIFLLTIAFIFAMILAWNLGIGDLVSTWPVEFTGKRFIISSLITYALLILIVCVAIWYPSRQAMKIQPSEALHEE